MDLVQQAVKSYHTKNENIPKFKAGDTIEVSVRVKEGEKERIQKFRGVCIKVQGAEASRCFTVRKMSDGIGVERTFPFTSPNVASVKVFAYGHVRRSRLFYLRALRGKAAKIRSDIAMDTVSQKSKKKDKKTAAPKTDAPA